MKKRFEEPTINELQGLIFLDSGLHLTMYPR